MPSPRVLVANPYRVGVLVLMLGTVCWRVWTLARWSWEDDDWLFIPRSESMSLWAYAFQDHNGHLMPGGFLVTKAVVEVAPLSFVPVVVVVTLASALLVAVWGRALELVSGGATLALVPLSLVTLSPIMIHSMQWWAVSVNAIPLLLCLGLMMIAAARYAGAPAARRRRHLLWMCLILVGGLFFWHKSLLVVYPAVIAVLALAPGPWRERFRITLAPVAALSVISGVYLVLFFLATRGVSSNNSVEMTLEGQTPERVVTDFARGFSHTFIPSTLGGPWGSLPNPGDPYARQGAAVTVMVLVVAALCLVWLAVRHRALVWLLVLPVVYVLVALSLVQFTTRAQVAVRWDLMTTERYYTDSVAVGAATMALMLGVHRRRTASHRGTARARHLVPAVVGTIAVSLVVGNILGAQSIGVHPGRDWAATVRGDVVRLTAARDDRTQPLVLWDAYAPSQVLPWGYWGEYASLSSMLRPLRPDIQFRRSTDQLYTVTPQGRVVEAQVTEAAHSQPGPQEGCGYAVTADAPVRVPMSGELYSWGWVVRLTAFSDTSAEAVVSLGSEEILFSMPAGLSSREIQHVGPVPSTIDVVLVSGDALLCVTEVVVAHMDEASDTSPK
ncbi:hypothetical protein [Nocardioides sp.]|uniref:hypothetical protein n=1 Tax=Nocardioides sp. TaxID=35761 RepID=UPI002CE8E90E|nr:hypothetical protein [Nocardioides sp.]HXH79142.1 hypothetical protein [Nocardioides sp.]